MDLPNPSGLLGMADVARRLGISRAAVHNAVDRGAMKAAIRVPGHALIDPVEVERYRLENLGAPGRPLKWIKFPVAQSIGCSDHGWQPAVIVDYGKDRMCLLCFNDTKQ